MQNKISMLKMTLTFFLSLCLILSNILSVKSIDLFGFSQLSNTCAIITFPITYVLSDIFSEVYGYKWSRITANFAFMGTAICSLMFEFMILIPGNSAWNSQNELIKILGNTPQISISSIIAFWVGDLVNDRVFQKMKEQHPRGNGFKTRAILSSLVGKYVDGIIFTFCGLSFLPIDTKIFMVLNCPLIQILLEIILLPVTVVAVKKLKKAENLDNA